MFCVKCGNELFDEAIICPKCGTPTQNFNSNSAEIGTNQNIHQSDISENDEVVIKCQFYNKGIDFAKISLSKLSIYSSELFNGVFKFQRDRLVIQIYSYNDNSFVRELAVPYDEIKENHLYEAKYMFVKMPALNFSSSSSEFSMVSNSKLKQIHNELSERCKNILY